MYFLTMKYGPCDLERLVGSNLVGYRIAFRRTGCARFNPPLQRQVFKNTSRFGALRALLVEGRRWHGKTYFLEVVSVEPVVEGVYEPVDDEDD